MPQRRIFQRQRPVPTRSARALPRAQEAAAREALGLPSISSELASLYGQLGEASSTLSRYKGPGQRSSPAYRTAAGERGRLQDEIAQANQQVRLDAGLAPVGYEPPPNRGTNRTAAAVAREQNRRTQELDSVPGLATALSTLLRDQSAAQKNVVNRETTEGTPFKSGAGGANLKTRDSLDRVTDLLSTNLEALRKNRDASSGIPDARPNGQQQPIPLAARTVLGRALDRFDRNTFHQTVRDSLVATRDRAQRDVRAINEAIYTGRRARRGSSVALPRFALAGLGQQSGRLL